MKVEKINENKIKITLTFEELEGREISIKDLEKDTSIAKNLFLDLIEESNLEDDFIIDDSQLFIEACYDNNNLFIVTITKIDNIPELKKYAALETKPKKSYTKKNVNNNIIKQNYKVDSNIYSFSSLDLILELCNILKKEKMFCGKNSLYKYNNTYFLIFSPSTIKNPKFLKTFVPISEFCTDYYSQDIFSTSIKEKSQLIFINNALQQLIKIC